MSAKLPAFMQSCLWSYDVSKIDPQKDQSQYSPDEIQSVISRPQRGMWQREALKRFALKPKISQHY
ncbi:MAG: hypothetical protein AAB973_03135 [Patescibacteria group bacterium]